MLINSLLACFILLTAGGEGQCTNEKQGEKVQEQQNQSSQNEYTIPAVIYFTADDLSETVETPRIETVETVDAVEIIQTFVIER